MCASTVKCHLEGLVRDGPPGQPLLQWGFVVYRTAYSPASDQLWQSLLDTIRSAVRTWVLDLAVGTRWSQYDDVKDILPEGAEACEQLLSMFHLDVREDPLTLSGASIEIVRQMAKEAAVKLPSIPHLEITNETRTPSDATVEEEEMHQRERERVLLRSSVFLYVDHQVLRSIERDLTPWIKVIEVDYEPARPQGNARWGPQRYFGAMIATLSSLSTLWDDLGCRELSNLAPVTEDCEMAILRDGAFGHDIVEARVRVRSGVLNFEV